MRKHLIVAVIICTVFIWLTACGEGAVETPEDQMGSDENINIEEIILQEDPYFTVMDMGGYEYYYAIYNSDGKLVKEGNAYQWQPVITYIDGNTIEIHTSAGTGIYFCTYYDILHDRFSELYESPLAAEYGKVAYLDCSVTVGETVLVVEDLFEENGYREEFYLDIPKVVTAVTDTIFIDDDLLYILYRSQDLQEERVSIIDLRDCTVTTGFSQRIYPINSELYNLETEREYKEAFYAAITNQVAMEYQGGRTVYFRDYFRNRNDLSDLSYLFLDCDGDGLPELAMDGFLQEGPCILKYLPEERRVAVFIQLRSEDWVLLGPGEAGCCFYLTSYADHYNYITWNSQGETEQVLFFEHNYNSSKKKDEYLVGTNPLFYIEKELWDEITEGFFEAMEHPMEMMSFEEVFGEDFSPKMLDDGEDYYQWLYDDWYDCYDYWWERNLPFADEKTFKTIKAAYGEIAFQGEFQQGDLELQEKYKRGFLKLLRNELPFLNQETGEMIYLKDFRDLTGDYELDITKCKYIFFDADEDGVPELGIRNEDYRLEEYFVKYDVETESFILWYEMIGSWEMWFGSGKLANPWGGAKYQYFAQLGENGEIECQTNCISDWYSEDLHLHMVMLPDYADEEREVTVTEEMMAQGVFIRYDNQWYFRLTEGQYNEVTAAFLEAYNWAGEEIYKVTYTYDELFGSFSTS